MAEAQALMDGFQHAEDSRTNFLFLHLPNIHLDLPPQIYYPLNADRCQF